MWKGDETKQFKDTNIVYNYKGKVYYITDSGKEIELLYKGYDKSRDMVFILNMRIKGYLGYH